MGTWIRNNRNKEMKKKKKYNSLKVERAIQRDLEIKEYGKIVSLRPSRVFKSKKCYKRNKKVEVEE